MHNREYRFFRIDWTSAPGMSKDLMDQIKEAAGGTENVIYSDWKPISISSDKDEVVVLAAREIDRSF